MHNPRFLSALTALFITTLIVSNIIAVKIGSVFGYFLPVAVIIFPLSYILGDVITEVYGYAASRRIIWTGFLCNLFAVAMIAIAIKIPAAPFYADSDAFAKILSSTPRILAASFVAYLIGSFANAYALSKLKVMMKGKFLWLRTIVSTVLGEGLDSVIFISLAFFGTFENAQILSLIFTQWIFKTVVETIITPITYIVVHALKKAEGVDHFDHNTNFSPLKF